MSGRNTKTTLLGMVVRFWLVCSVVLLAGMAALAHADTPVATLAETVQSAEITPKADAAPVIAPIKTKLAVMPEPNITVTVEGQTLESGLVTKNEQGALFVRAEPIFKLLNDDYEFDADQGALIVRRSQDGVVMELYTDTGIVKSNGKAIGKLRVFGEVTADLVNLTPNTIAVLAGTNPKLDKTTGELTFELDARLRVAKGYQLYVNDVPLDHVEPAAKSVGPVLLLPLLPIAKDLGHSVVVSSDSTTVTVRRAQDSAVFELDMTTGLVKRAGRPIGVSKDVTYIDSTNLLLPVSALETLTGTHITVVAGSDRVDIDLDDRLTGAIEPGENVNEKAALEPFTVEELRFTTGPDTLNQAELDFRVRKFNGRLRYSVPDLPTSATEAEPEWLSVQYRHLDGAYGTVGDYSADHRELDGIGIRRIKGVSVAKVIEEGKAKGRWAAAIGAPVIGSTRISEDQSRLEFKGLAAGVRFAHEDGWEAGASFKSDGLTDDQMAVLSAISGRLGRKTQEKLTWTAAADIGVFNGAARDKSVDLRANGSVRYDVSDTIDVDVHASLTGAEFLRSDLTAEALEEEIVNSIENQMVAQETETIPDVRKTGQDVLTTSVSVQYSPQRDIGILKNPGLAISAQRTIGGFSVGDEARVSVDSTSIAASTAIANTGAHITADYSQFTQTFAAGPDSGITGNTLNVRAYKDFEHAKIRAQYSHSQRSDNDDTEYLSASIATKSLRLKGPKGSSLSATPSITANWSPVSSSSRGGIIATADAGEIFGPKTRAQASLGVLQSFGGQTAQETQSYFSASIGRNLRLNDNLSLSLSYRNNLKGDQRLGLQLTGVYGFNRTRQYKVTDEGKGVLNGRAFYDKNRDGIRQDDESGFGGVIVRVNGAGKKLALRSDGQGNFTVQNISAGIHDIRVDNRSLPIGFSLSEDVKTRATISEGHLTTIDLPIVQRGQIRGFAYVDDNSNGAHDKGETRLEGARLRLLSLPDDGGSEPIEMEAVTTTFGQYAFDDLPAGQYQVEIVKTNSPDTAPLEPVLIDLGQDDDLMVRASIPAGVSKRSYSVEIDDTPWSAPATGPPKSADTPPDIPPDIAGDTGTGPAPPP